MRVVETAKRERAREKERNKATKAKTRKVSGRLKIPLGV
jgi:hypothetical protein